MIRSVSVVMMVQVIVGMVMGVGMDMSVFRLTGFRNYDFTAASTST
jgi:predicted RND superfamily exporter protein